MDNHLDSLLSFSASIITIISGLIGVLGVVERRKRKILLLFITIFIFAIFIKELILLTYKYMSVIIFITIFVSLTAFLILKSNEYPRQKFVTENKFYLAMICICALALAFQPIGLILLVENFSALQIGFLTNLEKLVSLKDIYTFLFTKDNIPLFIVPIINLVVWYVIVNSIKSVYYNEKYNIPINSLGWNVIYMLLLSILSCGCNYPFVAAIAQKL